MLGELYDGDHKLKLVEELVMSVIKAIYQIIQPRQLGHISSAVQEKLFKNSLRRTPYSCIESQHICACKVIQY